MKIKRPICNQNKLIVHQSALIWEIDPMEKFPTRFSWDQFIVWNQKPS